MKKLVYLAAVALIAFSCQTKEKKSDSGTTPEVLTPVAYEIVIEGMTCTGCEETIEGSVNKLEGIKMVEANHMNGNAMIEFFAEKTDTAAIRNAITGTGYKVVAFKTVEKSESPE